jgi:hypothetical protein
MFDGVTYTLAEANVASVYIFIGGKSASIRRG